MLYSKAGRSSLSMLVILYRWIACGKPPANGITVLWCPLGSMTLESFYDA
jgi:hypothetical protein